MRNLTLAWFAFFLYGGASSNGGVNVTPTVLIYFEGETAIFANKVTSEAPILFNSVLEAAAIAAQIAAGTSAVDPVSLEKTDFIGKPSAVEIPEVDTEIIP
mgnify:CR=1 FL=1